MQERFSCLGHKVGTRGVWLGGMSRGVKRANGQMKGEKGKGIERTHNRCKIISQNINCGKTSVVWDCQHHGAPIIGVVSFYKKNYRKCERLVKIRAIPMAKKN